MKTCGFATKQHSSSPSGTAVVTVSAFPARSPRASRSASWTTSSRLSSVVRGPPTPRRADRELRARVELGAALRTIAALEARGGPWRRGGLARQLERRIERRRLRSRRARMQRPHARFAGNRGARDPRRISRPRPASGSQSSRRPGMTCARARGPTRGERKRCSRLPNGSERVAQHAARFGEPRAAEPRRAQPPTMSA